MLNALVKILKMPQPLQIFEDGHKWEVSEAPVVKYDLRATIPKNPISNFYLKNRFR